MFRTEVIRGSLQWFDSITMKQAKVHVWIGDVEQNGVVHPRKALKVEVLKPSTRTPSEWTRYVTKGSSIFKGNDMFDKALEWLVKMNNEEFVGINQGALWLGELKQKWLKTL